jgi:hypothetical protein
MKTRNELEKKLNELKNGSSHIFTSSDYEFVKEAFDNLLETIELSDELHIMEDKMEELLTYEIESI